MAGEYMLIEKVENCNGVCEKFAIGVSMPLNTVPDKLLPYIGNHSELFVYCFSGQWI
jgi:hypothetical protein